MIEKAEKIMTGIPATAASAVFLVISLLLPEFGIDVPLYLDPAWLSIALSGLPIVYEAAGLLIHGKGIARISSSTLISIAMTAAVIIGDLFAAGEIAVIMAIGEILEDKTTDRAKRGLKKLVNLAPRQGRLITSGQEKTVDAASICAGDILRILPGEAIPVDGVIIKGETSVDQSVITGESLPVDKTVGEEVFCGTVNCFGAIDIKATKVGADSSLQRLISIVKEAESKKAPMARTADKWASRLVPTALILAVIAGILRRDITTAVTVLVVFCPCALVLATPTAIMAAIGQAAKHGVIIKSGEALENMGKVDTIAFDKTGTLTYGRPQVSDTVSFDKDFDEREILFLAGSAESMSEHPLGKAVSALAVQRGEITQPEKFKMTAGRGISALVDGKNILCGSEKFILENGIEISSEAQKTLNGFKEQGKAIIIAAVNGKLAGALALSDELKPNAADTLKELHENGVQSVLLTGDNEKTAGYFAALAGIDKVKAQLLPEEKVEAIKALQSEGKTVCMIGDGINDAPALKTAPVSIAMGAVGSDIAVDAADIALTSDDISKLPYLKRLSSATLKTIKLSISLSLLINFIAIILSFFAILNPTTGALVHNAGSCFVILIAALLYDRNFEKRPKK